MKARPLAAEDPLYPSSDGKPLAENDWQLWAILDAVSALRGYFEDRPDVYVSGDLLIYYEQGHPRKCVAPDVFVVKGAPDHRRMIYKLWEEPKAPDFVLEVASRNTWKEDVGPKRAIYAAMGVREYWLFDPKNEYFDPQLQGLVLADGVYRPLPARVEAGRRTLSSAELGLDLRVEGGNLVFRKAASGEPLPTYGEQQADLRRERAGRRTVEDALEREAAARRAAEARVAELEARLAAAGSGDAQ